MPISVSSTGSWKQRPKATMNLMVRFRYSLTVPWKTIPRHRAPARRLPPSTSSRAPKLLEAQEEVEGERRHDVEGEGGAEEEQKRRGDQERQERVLLAL